MTNNDEENLQRIQASLKRGAIQRNGKTALFVGLAISGAVMGTPGLIASIAGASLILATIKVINKNSNSSQ